MTDEEELYGIDRAHGHPRAIELVPDEFFWDCADELGPFGSDEGDTALEEFREWRLENPGEPVEDCIIWTIEAVGEMDASEYSDDIANEGTVAELMDDEDFDDQQYIYTLDISIIATGFGQLADEGRIDPEAKPYLARALKRQIVYAKLSTDWEHADQYIANLRKLEQVLQQA